MAETVRPPITLVVAVARNGIIGRAGDLPWRIPEDLAHFKRVTLAKPVLMGRKTFESIGRPLPGRTNIVVTRKADFAADGVEVAHDVDGGLALATARAEQGETPEICVIGGGQIYRATLPRADRIWLTEIEAEIDGDTYFPPLDRTAWTEVERRPSTDDPRASHPCTFVLLERKGP
jgi:dihydrofolate reductase